MSRLSFYYFHPSPSREGASLTQFSFPPVSPSPPLATCLVFVLRLRCVDDIMIVYLRTFSPGREMHDEVMGFCVGHFCTYLYCDTRSGVSFSPPLAVVWVRPVRCLDISYRCDRDSCPGDLGDFVMGEGPAMYGLGHRFLRCGTPMRLFVRVGSKFILRFDNVVSIRSYWECSHKGKSSSYPISPDSIIASSHVPEDDCGLFRYQLIMRRGDALSIIFFGRKRFSSVSYADLDSTTF